MAVVLVRTNGLWRPVGSTIPTAPTSFPDATNTGVPSGTTLKAVPGDITSGPGWSWNSSRGVINITGDNAVVDGVQLSGAEIDTVSGVSNITISNSKINLAGTTFGIALRSVNGVHITHCEIGGTRPNGGPDSDGTGRLQYAVKDIVTDSTNIEIDHCRIYDTANSISCPVNANIHDNLISKMGYIDSDHVDCILSEGSTNVTIQHNTLLCELGQTSAIALYSQSGPSDNVLVDNNFLGGGGYTVYGADFTDQGQFAGTNIRIINNQFTTTVPAQFGPVTAFDPSAQGNEWSNNTWADGPNAGLTITV